MPESHLFLYFAPEGGNPDCERVRVSLSQADYAKVNRRGHWQADVTDQASGKRYRVRGAACNLPGCMCDVRIVRELNTAKLA